MARKKTELNLQAELPEVRSTDFNLFYKPQEKPIDGINSALPLLKL